LLFVCRTEIASKKGCSVDLVNADERLYSCRVHAVNKYIPMLMMYFIFIGAFSFPIAVAKRISSKPLIKQARERFFG